MVTAVVVAVVVGGVVVLHRAFCRCNEVDRLLAEFDAETKASDARVCESIEREEGWA